MYKRQVLNRFINGQMKIHPLPGRNKALDLVGYGPVQVVGRKKQVALFPFQVFLVIGLQAGQAFIHSYKAEQLRGQGPVGIKSLPLGGKDNARDVYKRQLLPPSSCA